MDMIVRSAEKTTEIREKMRGGEGRVEVSAFLTADHLPKKCRLFSELRLEKGCGIGAHTHQQESEIFYVLSGEAVYNDNGVEQTLKVGDIAICKSGESHAVRNDKETPAVLLAVIILE